MITRLYLMPTQRCNGACTYCYLPHSVRGQVADMARLGRITDHFLADMARAGIPDAALQLRLIGGEPYLPGDEAVELLTRFLDQTERARVVVNTNGTLVTRAMLHRLAPHRHRVVHIISVDGPAHVHDTRRPLGTGEGSHARVMGAAEALAAEGFPLACNMVLDHHTVATMGALVDELAERLGLDALSVSLLHAPEDPLPVRARVDLLASAYAIAKARGVLLGGHHRLLLGSLVPAFRCLAGTHTALVTAAGDLVSCQRFVGHVDGLPYSPDIDFATVELDDSSERYCYSDEARQVARGLLDLYTERYPSYHAVTPFDLLLFGGLVPLADGRPTLEEPPWPCSDHRPR